MATAAVSYSREKYEVKGMGADNIGPVIGASVMEQGTTNGNVTDFDGTFSLKVSSKRQRCLQNSHEQDFADIAITITDERHKESFARAVGAIKLVASAPNLVWDVVTCVNQKTTRILLSSRSSCPSIRSNYSQGNIYEDDFMDVWNNSYQPYRDREWMRRDECASYKHFRYCEGNGMHLRDNDGKLMLCRLNELV